MEFESQRFQFFLQAVEMMLKRFDLSKYAHRRVDNLSGGNKRKLCAAISVMAPVAIVLMDEPTRYLLLNIILKFVQSHLY